MDGCDEFRRPETYKYNPLEQIFKKSNFEENLLICQLKYKYPLRQFFWVEFWMIKWYGVTDEIVLTKINWIKKFILEQKQNCWTPLN